MSAFSLVPKPSNEASVTGSVPRGTACSQMAYVVPPIAQLHHTTAMPHAIVPVSTLTTTQTTSSQDCRSRTGMVRRRRTVASWSARR